MNSGHVERALDLFGAPIYVRHEVVHNRHVVDGLRDKGVVFVEELNEVPDDAVVIFSAHGVSKSVQYEAKRRQLKVFDATCPLVTKVHMEVAKYSKEGYECILIGHAGHPEVEGTMGQFDNTHGGCIYLVESAEDVQKIEVNNPDKLAFVTQTTLSMDDTATVIDALRERFPTITGPRKDDICYATQNRQDAVKELSKQCDVVLVVGSANSSNSNRLREVAERNGTPAYLIDDEKSIDAKWFEDKEHIGLTAGASAPELLVQAIVKRLRELGVTAERQSSVIEENVTFSLPKELKR